MTLVPGPTHAQATARPPVEDIAGVDTTFGELKTSDGHTLRTIVTRPQQADGRLPGILFVQWLSCNTVQASENSRDGWSRMLRAVIQHSGHIVWRTDKAGVGGSTGNCATLDYNTELSHHREALAAFKRLPGVDPNRIVVFGGSMGANMAPLVAESQNVAGVMVWGGGARTWFERQLAFSRHAMELSGDAPARLSSRMRDHARFYAEYLLRSRTPPEIAAQNAALGAVWKDIVGTSADGHYGRPFSFHQQAHLQDWSRAWAAITAPVLVLYGEYDWFEDADAAQTIVRIVNRRSPGRATFALIPRMDHHFSQFPTPEAAFREQGGTVNETPAVEHMLAWLKQLSQPR